MNISDISLIALTAIIAIGAVAAAVAAFRANKQNKERLTLEFMRDYNNDARMVDALNVVYKLPKLGENEIVESYVKRPDGSSAQAGKERAALLFLLSKFEILAIGLARGIYDENLIRQCFGHDIVEFYKMSERVIEGIRKKDPKAFCEFERLAARVNTEHLQ